MNWKVMIPKIVGFFHFTQKKELYPRQSSSWTNLGFLDFFSDRGHGLAKKRDSCSPCQWDPDFGQLKGVLEKGLSWNSFYDVSVFQSLENFESTLEIPYLFTMIVSMAHDCTWKKIEPQRVSTHKKNPLKLKSMFASWFSSSFFSCHRGLNQDVLWPPGVGSLAPRIPMPPIPRFRATLCFRWLILVFLLIGGKLPTLRIFRSRSFKESICFRCSQFHLVFWFWKCDFEAQNWCIWKAASTGWGGSWRFNPFMISPLPLSQGVLVTEFRIQQGRSWSNLVAFRPRFSDYHCCLCLIVPMAKVKNIELDVDNCYLTMNHSVTHRAGGTDLWRVQRSARTGYLGPE